MSQERVLSKVEAKTGFRQVTRPEKADARQEAVIKPNRLEIPGGVISGIIPLALNQGNVNPETPPARLCRTRILNIALAFGPGARSRHA
jgi:hypothetical protein